MNDILILTADILERKILANFLLCSIFFINYFLTSLRFWKNEKKLLLLLNMILTGIKKLKS